jgi:VIT1/CCC1 family predicted Fe2+/Mn2+ transporter
MAADRKRLEMFYEMWVDELESADLYRTLAETSGDGRRRHVLNALAASEERHAAHWERVLRERGRTDLRRPPLSMRTRILGFLARRFGARAVLPFVLRLEAADAAKYREVAEAPDAMADEELAHGRTMVALGGGPTGEQIARSEGRHRAAAGGALRAAVFGVNDGLVSNLLLVLGVAGGTSDRGFLLLAGLAGLLAGAFSMAAGEWVSVQSQRELYEREIAVEAEELAAFPEEEMEELALIYQAKGLSQEEAEALAGRLIRKEDTALDTLAREELGLAVDDLGSPWVAAGSSFASFAAGAFVPVLPFLFSAGTAALVIASLLSGVTLMVVGAAIALLTGRSPLRGGLRMVAIAATVGVASHFIGRLIGAGVAA